MGSSPDIPPAVTTDPNVTAAGQQTYNTQAGTESQKGSMVNQNNVYGGLNYTQTGTSANGTPLYSASTYLSPLEQNLYDTFTGTRTAAGNQAAGALGFGNYGSVSPTQAIGDRTSGLTGQAVQAETKYLDPYYSQQTAQLDTQLRNQGFAPGQPGYDNAMNNLRQSQYQGLTGFIANTQPQMMQQATNEYLMPLQIGENLAQFGQPQTPNSSFVQTPSLSIQPANLIGAQANADNAQMAAYNAQMAQNNNMMSGLFGIPTAILGGMAKGGAFNSLLAAAPLAAV
jgi:hypothetical protein